MRSFAALLLSIVMAFTGCLLIAALWSSYQFSTH